MLSLDDNKWLSLDPPDRRRRTALTPTIWHYECLRYVSAMKYFQSKLENMDEDKLKVACSKT